MTGVIPTGKYRYIDKLFAAYIPTDIADIILCPHTYLYYRYVGIILYLPSHADDLLHRQL